MTSRISAAGWSLHVHDELQAKMEESAREYASLAQASPHRHAQHPGVKFLRRLNDLMFQEIPGKGPNHPDYRLGKTLGKTNTYWRRAKFLGRFRLFFRFDSVRRIIVYVWVNDENSLRKAGDKNDPYAVFARMLAAGDPPPDLDALLAQARTLTGRKDPPP